MTRPPAGRYRREIPGATRGESAWQLALVYNLTRRQIEMQYKGSALGMLWSLLNPLLQMMVYLFLFRIVLRIEIPGVPYGLYFLAGFCVWQCITQSIQNNLIVFPECRGLIECYRFPTWALPVSRVAAAHFQFLVASALVFALAAWYGKLTLVGVLMFPAAVAITFVLSTGLALMAATLTARFRDLAHVVDFALTLGYFASPIIYPIWKVTENRPEWVRQVYLSNPISGLVTLMHASVLDFELPMTAVASAAGGAVVAFALGCAVYRRFRDRLLVLT